MANPLFNMLGNNASLPNNMGQLVQQFKQFKQTFRGDPRQQIQQLLNSGRVSQSQYNQAVQIANSLAQLLK